MATIGNSSTFFCRHEVWWIHKIGGGDPVICGLEDCEALDYIWKKVEWGVFGGFNGWVALDLALASRNGFRTEGAYHNF